ncbi:MAG: twin-arginine translocase subunit TatC [Chloroflexi bacterium]|jgi:sec-independent protein translocase protein TatC|nr:twin-arginine translocase subunit TatC [Chloroflexota bacterium]
MSDTAEKQPILAHIHELRRRLTWAVGALLVGTIVSFIFAEDLLTFLIAPYGARVQAISPTDTIETYFKVALVSGAILTMPIILLQIWLFVSPGLERHERRLVYIFVPAAFGLFLTGIVFSWLVLLPAAIRFLADFMPDIFNVEWTAPEYIGFTTSFLFWIGVSFEMPLVIYLLARVGLVTAAALREHWRVAVVAIAILSAVITPSIDPMTMMLTMAPLIVLYLVSIVLAVVGERQFQRSMAVT